MRTTFRLSLLLVGFSFSFVLVVDQRRCVMAVANKDQSHTVCKRTYPMLFKYIHERHYVFFVLLCLAWLPGTQMP